MWIKGLISWRISSWAEVSARLLVDYIERDTPQDAIQPGLKILARYFQTGLGFLARPNGLKNPCNRYHFFQPGSKKEREHAHRLCFWTSVNFLKEICVLSPGWNWACDCKNIFAQWAERNFSPGWNSPCNEALGLLVLYSASRGFSPGILAFPSLQKPTLALIWIVGFSWQSPQLVLQDITIK